MSAHYLYSFEVIGPGSKRTNYGLAWPKKDDKAARRYVKSWADDYHGKGNRVVLIGCIKLKSTIKEPQSCTSLGGNP